MLSIFWGIIIEISRELISGLENVKTSLLGTVQQFSVVYMLIFFLYGRNVEELNEELFLSLKQKNDSTPKGIILHVTTN